VRHAHAYREQRERPRGRSQLQPEKHITTQTLVGPSGTERVAAVQRQAQWHRDEKGRCERNERKADGLPRAAEYN